MKHKHPKKDPHAGEDRARMIVALVISIAILFGFQFYTGGQKQVQKPVENVISKDQKADVAKMPMQNRQRAEVLADTGARVMIEGKKVSGSFALKGNRIDDLLLNDQKVAVDSDVNVALLTPSGSKGAYYVESGWIADDASVALPGENTVWTQDKSKGATVLESGGKPVIMHWNNGQGLTFEREILLDENYLFTIKQRVINNSSKEVSLHPYHLAARHGLPEGFSGFFVLHEGPMAYLGDDFEDPAYKSLAKGKAFERENTTGWIGITDKYWMVTLLPHPQTTFTARMVASPNGPDTVYQTDSVAAAVKVAPGATGEETTSIYAGVKNLPLIQAYQNTYGYKNLELTMDFGMWYFITKPFYFLLHFLMHGLGSVAAAILMMTVIVRMAVFPLASKSFRSMAKMRLVAPQIKELQEKHKDDKQKMQAAIFELYKKEQANPFSGCWPMLIQVPIFFALYKVILISVELRHAPFWGWIQDLSAPDPTSVFNLFGLLPFTPPPFLMIGGWGVLFCLSMVMQQRISPPPTDPTQENIQKYFPFFVTFMMAHFAAGLVIYWTWSNILGTLQQFYILKKVGGEETSLIRGHSARRKPKKAKE